MFHEASDNICTDLLVVVLLVVHSAEAFFRNMMGIEGSIGRALSKTDPSYRDRRAVGALRGVGNA